MRAAGHPEQGQRIALPHIFTPNQPHMMRTILLLPALLFSGAFSAQQVLITQDFESLDPGDPVAQTLGLPWTTWSNAPGGTEDAQASDLLAHSGSISPRFVASTTQGGPADMILRLGNRTSGQYLLSWWMHVPAGKGGYFNLQKSETAGQSWSIEVTLTASGAIELSSNAQAGGATTYPTGQWFEVSIAIDLNSSSATLSIDGAVAATWLTTTASGSGGVGLNQIGAVNFFAYGGTDLGEYFIDDVSFVDLTGLSVPDAAQAEAMTFPNPTSGAFVIDLAGLSPNASATVLDATGRRVATALPTIRRGAFARMEADLGSEPPGVYFVRIRDGEREVVRRVTKH